MSEKIALLVSVKETNLNYSDEATSGVDNMTNNLQYALINAFPNARMVQNKVTKQRVIESLEEAADNLSPGGFCLIYLHGHGDSIRQNDPQENETEDQVFICYDDYLRDDEIDRLLQRFDSSCRILTIADCCSSNTLVEWKNSEASYPQIIHLASANDHGYAYASPSGGFMTNQIVNIVFQWAYTNHTYQSFVEGLKHSMSLIGYPFFSKLNDQVTDEYLNKNLFT